jgi:hypothetical protein
LSELTGVVLVALGTSALVATGALAASSLRLRSPVAFLLAAYLLSWTWLVVATFALSPAGWLTRGSLLAELLLGAALAFGAWAAAGRPRPPAVHPALRSLRDAARDPAILALGTAVVLAIVYMGALAFLTPPNDLDVYHLARASLWRQQHGLGHIADVGDARINLFPPNAEIGQLATMLLSGSDRYVAIPQLAAYAALLLTVAGLARGIGLTDREAVFGALAFATLPLVAIEAPTAMNDLVVASFLASGAYFALGQDRANLPLLGLATALALGTKFTSIVALPLLALVAAVAQPRRRWPAALAAGVAGCVGGSVWYVVNFVETGGIGTDVPSQPEQRADLSPALLTLTAVRLAISFVDMSGAPWPYSTAFLVAAGVLGATGVIVLRRSRGRGRSLLAAAALTAAVVAVPLLWDALVRVPFKLALQLGWRDELDRLGWVFNTKAEPLVAWYGPLGLLLVGAASAAVVALVIRGRLLGLAALFASGPLILIATMTFLVTYDVTRGRFLVFGVVLAAATWGVALRWRSAAFAVAAIGATSCFLALTNYSGKSSGLYAEPSIWGMARWEAQTIRNPVRYAGVVAEVEKAIPEDAHVALSIVAEDVIHPFFGSRLTRRISLVAPDGGTPPDDSEWLVLAPEAELRRCPESWRRTYEDDQGWRVEQRLAPDSCLR